MKKEEIKGFVKKSEEIDLFNENKDILDVNYKKLRIREIFYSLQGEGGRSGEASIFIRLAHCNQNCWFCDTDWSIGDEMTVVDIANKIIHEMIPGKTTLGKWIMWTGGEPTLQLTDEIVKYFKDLGFKQAIETNGTNVPPKGLDYIVSSPKISVEKLKKSFPNGLDEIRYPYGDKYKTVPNIKDLPQATHYYISPLFLGDPKKRFELDQDNLQMCIDFCLENPEWKLSTQNHKLWNIR